MSIVVRFVVEDAKVGATANCETNDFCGENKCIRKQSPFIF